MAKENIFISGEGAIGKGNKKVIDFSIGLCGSHNDRIACQFVLTLDEVNELLQIIGREYLQLKDYPESRLRYMSHTPARAKTWLDKLISDESWEHGGQGMAD